MSSKVKGDSKGARKIKVVRIIDRLNIGGPARHVVWLTAGLDHERFDTTLITGTVPPGEGDMSYFAAENGVEPIVIERMSRELGLQDILVILNLLRILFRLRPDIIHTHKSKAGATGRVAAFLYRWMTLSALIFRPRKCKIVHTFHGHIFRGYYGEFRTRIFVLIERLLARLGTDRILVLSEQQRQEICEHFRVGRLEQFKVIPLGLELSEGQTASTSPKAELDPTGRELLIGIVGRLCEVKNHSMFLDAAGSIVKDSATAESPARFVVIGDGHLRRDLEGRAAELGIVERVTFTGFRKDAGRLYEGLDIVALTSVNEGTPLTLIEAMAAGRPVVSTRVGGVQDIMGRKRYSREGFTVWDHGVTVESGDVGSLANALKFMIDRPRLREDMGERGHAFVAAGFSRARLIRDIEELYSDLAGVRPDDVGAVAGESGACELPQAAGVL